MLITTGCGNSTNTNSNDNNTSLLNGGTYKVPLKQIYVDIPNFNKIEEGYTRIYWNKGISYITFTCLYDDSANDINDAHSKLISKFLVNVMDHHHVNELGKVSKKTLVINDISTLNFEGDISAGTNPVYNAYIYGYSFVYQGYPTSIIGVVRDEAQPQSEKNNVKQIVDEMMKTVRTQK